MLSIIRTILFFTFLNLIITILGYLIGGKIGLYIVSLLSWATTFAIYIYGERLILSVTGAKLLDKYVSQEVFRIVDELCFKIGLPKPRIYLTPDIQANIFSVGRGSGNASIVLTRGLLNYLSKEELTSVIAHELMHIKKFDVLSVTMGVSLASAVLFIANMSFYNGNEKNENKSEIINKLINVLIIFASKIIKTTIFSSREFGADREVARLFGSGMFLTSALTKIKNSAINNPIQTNPAFSSLYIVDPFGDLVGRIPKLFSTHPSVEERISRLEKV